MKKNYITNKDRYDKDTVAKTLRNVDKMIINVVEEFKQETPKSEMILNDLEIIQKIASTELNKTPGDDPYRDLLLKFCDSMTKTMATHEKLETKFDGHLKTLSDARKKGSKNHKTEFKLTDEEFKLRKQWDKRMRVFLEAQTARYRVNHDLYIGFIKQLLNGNAKTQLLELITEMAVIARGFNDVYTDLIETYEEEGKGMDLFEKNAKALKGLIRKPLSTPLNDIFHIENFVKKHLNDLKANLHFLAEYSLNVKITPGVKSPYWNVREGCKKLARIIEKKATKTPDGSTNLDDYQVTDSFGGHRMPRDLIHNEECYERLIKLFDNKDKFIIIKQENHWWAIGINRVKKNITKDIGSKCFYIDDKINYWFTHLTPKDLPCNGLPLTFNDCFEIGETLIVEEIGIPQEVYALKNQAHKAYDMMRIMDHSFAEQINQFSKDKMEIMNAWDKAVSELQVAADATDVAVAKTPMSPKSPRDKPSSGNGARLWGKAFAGIKKDADIPPPKAKYNVCCDFEEPSKFVLDMTSQNHVGRRSASNLGIANRAKSRNHTKPSFTDAPTYAQHECSFELDSDDESSDSEKKLNEEGPGGSNS